MSNPISADTTRIAFVPETTAGVTPATPVFQIARITSEGLSFNASTTLSNEFNSNRQVTDVIVSGGSSGGDLGFELSRNPWWEEMLAGTFGNDWGASGVGNRMEVGTILKTYTIEKAFASDPTATPPAFDYHRITRAMIDAMTLTFTPTAAATGSITILGGSLAREENGLTGATYEDAGLRPVMLGSDVIPVIFRIGGVNYTTWCFSQIVVNFRNNGRAIECLGTVGAAQMALGRFECEITMTVYASAGTHVIMDTFLDKGEVAVGFETRDSIGNYYFFEADRCRVQTCTQVAGGTNQDVVLAITLQALMGPTATPPLPSVQSCIVVYREPETPLDAPVGAVAPLRTKAGGSFSPSFYDEYGKMTEADLDKMREGITPTGAPTPAATPPRTSRKRTTEPVEA